MALLDEQNNEEASDLLWEAREARLEQGDSAYLFVFPRFVVTQTDAQIGVIQQMELWLHVFDQI